MVFPAPRAALGSGGRTALESASTIEPLSSAVFSRAEDGVWIRIVRTMLGSGLVFDLSCAEDGAGIGIGRMG